MSVGSVSSTFPLPCFDSFALSAPAGPGPGGPTPSCALFAAQNLALEKLVRGDPLEEVFTALVQALEADLASGAIAAILLLDADTRCLRHGAAPSLPESYNRAIDGLAIGTDLGTCCAAAARNEVVVTVDIANDPGWSAFKSLPLALGLRAAWSMPIRSAHGAVLGTFGTYFHECRAPTDTEREIVGVLARTAAIAIEHRATAAALRESEVFSKSLVAAAADCIKVLDLDGRLRWVSENGLCAMQIPDLSVVRGADWAAFWPEAATREAARVAVEAARAGGIGRLQGFCPTFAGTPKWWDVLVSAIRDDRGAPTALLCVSRDLTEQKNGERALTESEERARTLAQELEARVARRTAELATGNAQLRSEMAARAAAERARLQLCQKLTMAEENERRRISRELHDEAGQGLTALRFGLEALRDKSASPELRTALGRLESVADQVERQIHDVALKLRPPVLDDLGLERALEQHVQDWSARVQIGVDFHYSPTGTRLPAAIESSLYRIVQEALNNVLKHARAQRVSLIVTVRPNQVLAIVEDDGVGCDLEAWVGEGPGAHLGWLGMRERVALLSGTLCIESKPGGGTALFVRLPLRASETKHD